MNLTTTIGMQSEIFTPITPKLVWTPMTKALKDCKIGLASAAGVHMKVQEPFGKVGDWSFREIPYNLKPEELMVTHGGYDNGDVNKDINCMFPYQRLNELKKEGYIKDVASIHCGFMGGGGLQDKFREYTGPGIADIFKKQNVDAVVLTAG